MDKRQKARGVALISVMVVVTVVAASASQLLYRQSIDIERTTRIMSREQAFLLVFGLETLARDILARDNEKVDYYFDFRGYEEEDPQAELWSWPIPNQHMSDELLDAFRRIEAGRLEARLHDLSGLFNVNGVRQAVVSRDQDNKPNQWERMYEGLFKNLVNSMFGSDDADVPDADALWNALVDWFDADDETREFGAEDDEYLDRDPPYLTGQRRMAWPEEIRLIEGFEGKVADRLLPLVAVLPHLGQVKMNINTVNDTLLRHMPDLEDADAGEILSRRSDEDYFTAKNRVDSFFSSLRKAQNQDNAQNQDKGTLRLEEFFDVRSDFFLFSACVSFGRDRPIELQSVLRRKKLKDAEKAAGQDKVVVLQRRMGSGYYKGDNDCRAGARRPRSGGSDDDEPEDNFNDA